MRIKPIKTDVDYEAALKEVEHLFDAKPGTAESDRLEVLTTLIEAMLIQPYATLKCVPKADIIARMKGRATVKMTTDEIMWLTRGNPCRQQCHPGLSCCRSPLV
jgi:antitoxin component HigA of HigAB toxin-antitoxin module